MANRIDSSNRGLIEEMIERGSSNADISRMTGVLKCDIEKFRQNPDFYKKKGSAKKSAEVTIQVPENASVKASHGGSGEIPLTVIDKKEPLISEIYEGVSDNNSKAADKTQSIKQRQLTKLSESDVDKIVERILAGDKFIDIASGFNVTPMMISRIANGTSWKQYVGNRLEKYVPNPPRSTEKSDPLIRYIDDIAKDILSGYPIDEIARKYRVKKDTVRKWISKKLRIRSFEKYDFSNYTPDYSLSFTEDDIVPEYPMSPLRDRKVGKFDGKIREIEVSGTKTKSKYIHRAQQQNECDIKPSEPSDEYANPMPKEIHTPLIHISKTNDTINISLNTKNNCTITFGDNSIDVKWN